MITFKVKYKTYIVNLYVPEKKTGRVVLLLPGLPASTNINNILKPFLDAGTVVFYPYFSGSYDSGGTFSATQSIRDVSALYPLTQMSVVTELYFGGQIELGLPRETIVAGMSYGAAMALFGHTNLYQKIILLSPALLFTPLDIGGEAGKSFHARMKSLFSFLKDAYPFTYRQGFSWDLKRFLLGQSTLTQRGSITDYLNKIQCPCLIVHGEEDASVPVGVTRSLEQEIMNANISWRYIDSGHSTSTYSDTDLSIIREFIET
jgi:pimeloyl-ACP methyl ester carboxylesterase